MRPMTRNGHAYPDYEELKRDAPGSSVRIFVLIVYMLVNVIVTAALILLVVMAPTRYFISVSFKILLLHYFQVHTGGIWNLAIRASIRNLDEI